MKSVKTTRVESLISSKMDLSVGDIVYVLYDDHYANRIVIKGKIVSIVEAENDIEITFFEVDINGVIVNVYPEYIFLSEESAYRKYVYDLQNEIEFDENHIKDLQFKIKETVSEIHIKMDEIRNIKNRFKIYA